MYLNCHSYFSFKFGTMSQEALLKEAVAKGVHKLVLTDVNNSSGVLDFIRLAQQYNVSPVVGIDFRKRVQQKFIGIAKNNEGFRELNDFLSKCLREGETGLTGREAMIPDRASGFEHAFVIYPFSVVSSLRGTKGEDVGALDEAISSSRHLTSNEGIASSPSHTNPRMLLAMTFKPPEKCILNTPALAVLQSCTLTVILISVSSSAP